MSFFYKKPWALGVEMKKFLWSLKGNCVFLTLRLLIDALDVASPLAMTIVFLYLQLHSGEHGHGRLALLYLQFV